MWYLFIQIENDSLYTVKGEAQTLKAALFTLQEIEFPWDKKFLKKVDFKVKMCKS